jgi:hypothetical protein
MAQTFPMKPRLDRHRPSRAAVGPRQASMTAAAVRARRYRQRRKNGVRCLVVEISRMEIQALVKAVQTQRADAEVKRAIHALLNASYVTGGCGSEAHCGDPIKPGGRRWRELLCMVWSRGRRWVRTGRFASGRFAGSTLWFIRTALRRLQRRGFQVVGAQGLEPWTR